MLTALRKLDGIRVEASAAERGIQYICPEDSCRHNLILKKPLLKIDHFAHEPGAKCRLAARETPEHLKAKAILLHAFRARDLRAEVEFAFNFFPAEEDRRADVVVWSPKTKTPVAFEVQHTVLQLEEVMRRTKSYFTNGIPVVWISLLKHHRVEDAERIRGTKINRVAKFTTHAWERWAHDFSDQTSGNSDSPHGHLWFLDPATALMWRGWFLPHYLFKEGSDFYDSSGEEQSYPSYWYQSTKFHDLNFEGPFQVDALRVKPHSRSEDSDGEYCYPGGSAAWLLAPSDGDQRPKRPLIRMTQERLENGVELPPTHQMCVNGIWTDTTRDRAIDAKALWT